MAPGRQGGQQSAELPVRVCKLSNGKICQLLQHDVTVKFDRRPGWSLVARPIEAPTTQQAVWWVQSTQIAWILEIT